MENLIKKKGHYLLITETYLFKLSQFIKKTHLYLIDILFYIVLLLTQLSYNRPIFIISIPYGRWGNRLMLYSYLIAWSMKYNCIAMNPSFSEYSFFFRYFENNCIGLIPKKYNFLSYILKLFRINFQNALERITLRPNNFPFLFKVDLEKDYINTKRINFAKLLNGNKIILFHGFLFGDRDFKLLENQRKYLSQLFSFSEEIQGQCLEVIRSINKNKIIGICMRQGDYKDHFNGKFYLNDEEYSRLISRIQLQYPDHGIFIACEEMKDNFQISEAVISFQNPALNLCILSSCDLLLGPPSTFMTWASFYRDSPVCYIDKFSWNRKDYIFETTSF